MTITKKNNKPVIDKLPINEKGYPEGEKEEIKIERIKKEGNIRKLDDLFRMEKGIIKKKQTLREFTEPILMYIRTNRTVEFYDGVKEGIYTVEGSDGKDVKYEFETQDLLTFDYAGKDFRGYIQYEKEAMPYPRKPWVIKELIENRVDKILTDMSKWKVLEERAKLGKWWAIAGMIAIVGGIIILYQMMVEDKTAIIPLVNTTTEIINQTINNTVDQIL